MKLLKPIGRSPIVLLTATLLTCTQPALAGNSPYQSGAETDVGNETSGELTLREAVDLTLRSNPELASFDKEIRALEGLTLQAGLLSNPVLGLIGDEIGRDHSTAIRLSQLIELGGKRNARVVAASAAREVAERDFAARRNEILTRLAQTFTDVLAAQRRTTLAGQNLQLARKVTDAVAKRVQAGKVSPVEETKARLVSSSAGIALEQAQRDLSASRKRLTLFWGNASPQFSKATGNLEALIDLPPLNVLTERMGSNPELLRSAKNVSQRQALLELEKTRRIPDVTIGAGIKRFHVDSENTLVFDVGIPLPLFDRNQGNLQAAYQRLDKSQDEQRATELRVTSDLVQTYEAIAAAENQIRTLRNEILPGAESAFDAANKGYQLGKFGFLEVLDAQRTLFQNQALYLQAIAAYQRLIADLERLVAAPLDKSSPN